MEKFREPDGILHLVLDQLKKKDLLMTEDHAITLGPHRIQLLSTELMKEVMVYIKERSGAPVVQCTLSFGVSVPPDFVEKAGALSQNFQTMLDQAAKQVEKDQIPIARQP